MHFRPAVLLAALAVALASLPSAACAQRESFEGSATRAQAKVLEDKLYDLNGDGKVDDRERELMMKNLYLQNAVNPTTGEVDKEKLKQLQANRKRLQAEARAREREEAAVEKLRERQARGQRLTEADATRIRAADAAAELRRRERERETREAAKAPRSQAGERLAAPILNY